MNKSWRQLHSSPLDHTHLHFTYYTRFITHNELFLSHPAIQSLIRPSFFGDPVELEPVTDFPRCCGWMYLKVMGHVERLMLKSHKWPCLSRQQSPQPLRTGVPHSHHPKIHLPTGCRPAVNELIAIYITKGHAPSNCKLFAWTKSAADLSRAPIDGWLCVFHTLSQRASFF